MSGFGKNNGQLLYVSEKQWALKSNLSAVWFCLRFAFKNKICLVFCFVINFSFFRNQTLLLRKYATLVLAT